MITRNKLARMRLAQRQKGFTLTEIAIVLGIIGLILGAIWVAAAGVYTNQRNAHANTAILQIAQGIRTLYASSSNTGYNAVGDITATMVNAGVIPSDLSGGTGPFPSGSTSVVSTADGLGFYIYMSAVPKSSCITLLTTIAGNSRDAGLFWAASTASTNIAAVSAQFSGNVNSPLTAPLTPSSIATAAYCGSTINNVLFGFTLK